MLVSENAEIVTTPLKLMFKELDFEQQQLLII